MKRKKKMRPKRNITASDIVKALATRHSKDVFIPECKNGPTVFGPHSRMDVWAMKKSWSAPAIYGYEIKISRNDFFQDNKWHDYLSLCSDFYFVCPPKVISVSEVPEQAGLLWTSTNGTRLFNKKKAPHRDIDPPIELMFYVLMQYAPTGFNYEHEFWRYQNYNKDEFWRAWLEKKEINRDLGYKVKTALRAKIHKEILDVRSENKRLKSHMIELERLSVIADKVGLRLADWTDYETEVVKINQAFNRGKILYSVQELKRLSSHVNKAVEIIENGSPNVQA